MGVVYFGSCEETIFSTFGVYMKPRKGVYYFFLVAHLLTMNIHIYIYIKCKLNVMTNSSCSFKLLIIFS